LVDEPVVNAVWTAMQAIRFGDNSQPGTSPFVNEIDIYRPTSCPYRLKTLSQCATLDGDGHWDPATMAAWPAEMYCWNAAARAMRLGCPASPGIWGHAPYASGAYSAAGPYKLSMRQQEPGSQSYVGIRVVFAYNAPTPVVHFRLQMTAYAVMQLAVNQS
jgi:hypothetical protein